MKQPANGMTLQLAARLLKRRGIATGPKKIFGQLREVGLLSGSMPCVAASIHDWLVVQGRHVDRPNFHQDYNRIFITPAGLNEAEKRLLEKYPAPEPGPDYLFFGGQELDLGNGSECRLGF